MTPRQLSELIQVPVMTLQDWRNNGDGPEWVKVGRLVRYRLSTVREWIDGLSGTR